MKKTDDILRYIELERQSLKCLVRNTHGNLSETGELVDTLLSNIEHIITKEVQKCVKQ